MVSPRILWQWTELNVFVTMLFVINHSCTLVISLPCNWDPSIVITDPGNDHFNHHFMCILLPKNKSILYSSRFPTKCIASSDK